MFPHVVKASEYRDGVISGDILTGELAKAACKRQVDDLKKWPATTAEECIERGDPYWFDPKKGEKVCKFIETLPHVKGKWAAKRELIELQAHQCFRLSTLFGWVKPDGTRRFSEAYNEIPRKNGKSIEAAGVGLYCFCADGEYGAEVYSGATSEKQAWEVFRPAKQMAERAEFLKDTFSININAKNMIRLQDYSRFEPVIGNPGDGSSPSCAIIDEYHEHKTSDLYDTMVTGMGARDQGLAFIITTAGDNLAGPCYAKRDYSIKVLKGIIKDDSLFAIIYTADEGDDWTDINTLRKANPNFDVSVRASFLAEQLEKAKNNPRIQASFKTKHLNMWVGSRSAWMNMEAWRMCPGRKSLEELKGRPCFAALDLASKLDITAYMKLFPPHGDDPLWHVHGKYYLPEDVIDKKSSPNISAYTQWNKEGLITLTPGNVTDYEYIKDDIIEDSKEFELLEIPYDPWNATHLASLLLEDGANMIEYRPTVQNFSEPMKELEAMVYAKKIAHGNCPVLTWMASNVTAKLDKKDNIYPNKEQTESKIDGIIALIMTIGRARLHEEQQDISAFINSPLRA
jgi:phage terminase large subunit-like protein